MNYTRWQRFALLGTQKHNSFFYLFTYLFFLGKALIGINTHRVQPLCCSHRLEPSNNNRKIMNPTLWFMTSYSNKLVTCPTASAELRAFSFAAFGRGHSNFAALIYVVITGSNAQSYAEPLPSRWTVSGALPEHSKAFMGVAVMSWRLRAY